MATTEFVPDQAKTEEVDGPRHLDDHRPVLRRRLGRDDLAATRASRTSSPGDPGDAEGRRPQPGARVRERRGVHEGWCDAEAASWIRSCSVVEGSIAQREAHRRGPLGRDRRRPGDRPADHDQRMARPPRAEGRGRGRDRHLRHLRRHPGDEEQPDRGDGRGRPSGLELEVERRPAGDQHPGLPGAAGQHDRGRCSIWRCTSPGCAPVPDLDEQLRPRWLFGRTVREGCNRAGFSEEGEFATEYGDDPRCLVKLGCKGPVVKCNVPVRGWVDGYGGCPNVGGICMACTMPGFPDKFMPFMDEDPAGAMAARLEQFTFGRLFKTISATATSRTSTTSSPSGANRPRGSAPAISRATTRRKRNPQWRHGDTARRPEGHGQGDVVGSDHPDRRQPRHPHRDRLLESARSSSATARR